MHATDLALEMNRRKLKIAAPASDLYHSR